MASVHLYELWYLLLSHAGMFSTTAIECIFCHLHSDRCCSHKTRSFFFGPTLSFIWNALHHKWINFPKIAKCDTLFSYWHEIFMVAPVTAPFFTILFSNRNSYIACHSLSVRSFLHLSLTTSSCVLGVFMVIQMYVLTVGVCSTNNFQRVLPHRCVENQHPLLVIFWAVFVACDKIILLLCTTLCTDLLPLHV